MKHEMVKFPYTKVLRCRSHRRRMMTRIVGRTRLTNYSHLFPFVYDSTDKVRYLLPKFRVLCTEINRDI